MPEAQSGNLGYVVAGSSVLLEFTRWTAVKEFGVNTYTPGGNSGWQRTAKGNLKYSGTIEGKYRSDQPVGNVLDSTSTVSLELHFDGDGTAGNGDYLSGSARVSNLRYDVNPDTGETESWTADFESHDAWSETYA